MRVLDLVHRADAWWHDLRRKEPSGTFMLAAGPAHPMLTESFGAWMDESARHRTSDEPPVAVGLATDAGPRTRNEDSAVVFVTQADRGPSAYPLVFAAVADGMGGRPSGDLASAITIKTLTEYILDHLVWPEAEGKTRADSADQVLGILREGVYEADRAVLAGAPGGGTTVTCLLLRGLDMYLAHLGDSRAYWLNAYGLRVLTYDHSLVHFLQESGYITARQAASHKQRHVLYRGIGLGGEVEVDLAHQVITPGSCLLLCTDGVWNSLSDEAIHDLIRRIEQPDELCGLLVENAISAGSNDNATAVAIHIPDWR